MTSALRQYKNSTVKQGLKYLKMSTTHRGTMEGPKAPSEAWRRGVPRGGVWGAPPQYGGLGALPPEIF